MEVLLWQYFPQFTKFIFIGEDKVQVAMTSDFQRDWH